MNPTPSDVHVNAPLTNISIAMLQSAANFVAARVFPVVPVSKQSDRYYTYDRGEFNRDQMALRAPATESAGGGYKIDNTPTYYCNVWALHKDIDDQTRGNADAALSLDREATEWLTLQALIRREKIFAANYFSTSKWTTEYSGIATGTGGMSFTRWNDSNADPIVNVRAGVRAMAQLTGIRPNKMVLGRAVYDALVDHPDIVDRIKYGQTAGGPAMSNRNTLAQLFELDEILVMDSIENTADEGQTASHSFIGGKHAMLVYSPPNPGLMTPAAGYTFSWTGLPGSGPEGNRISTFRMDHLKADRVEIEMCFDQKLIAPDLGVFFKDAVA